MYGTVYLEMNAAAIQRQLSYWVFEFPQLNK